MKRTNQEPSQDETALKLKPEKARPLQYATFRAAAVGDQIITFNELQTAVEEQVREIMAGRQEPMTSRPRQRMLFNQVAASVLNHLIDRALILQEAKHKMEKNSKGQQQFNDMIERIWKTDEIPPCSASMPWPTSTS